VAQLHEGEAAVPSEIHQLLVNSLEGHGSSVAWSGKLLTARVGLATVALFMYDGMMLQ
jgi:hypothetical protein